MGQGMMGSDHLLLDQQLAQRLQNAGIQQQVLNNYHMQVAAGCLTNLVDVNDNQDDLTSKARLAVRAASALLNAYGIKSQIVNEPDANTKPPQAYHSPDKDPGPPA